MIHLLLIALALPFMGIEACTGLKLTAKDGKTVHGRTLEFGNPIELSLTYIPKGASFTGKTNNGDGLKYQAKYSALGAIAFDDISILDGINEKGLSVGTFYFPTFAKYTDLTPENQSKALSPINFPNWILTQFESVDEVKNALSGVVITPLINKAWGNEPPPFHYIVYEKSGKSLVIEPINGKLVAYNNPLGVLTNSPGFDWHIINLRNYIHLSPENASAVKLDNIDFLPLGQGTGLLGLPGDFSPPSRFVRASVFSGTAVIPANAEEGVEQVFHLLNQFDIPKGAVEEDNKGQKHYDTTQITCVRDPHALKFYFKSYEDQSIKVADLTQISGDQIKKVKISGQTRPENVSSLLK